jgi:hypothetical protein
MNITYHAILDANNKVLNLFSFDVDQKPYDILDEETNEILSTIIPQPEDVLEIYPDCTLKQYSFDDSITNTPASIDYTYNENLNAFIRPCLDETYILNTETFEWEPDPELEYDLHGDGMMYKWIGIGWQPVPDPEPPLTNDPESPIISG